MSANEAMIDEMTNAHKEAARLAALDELEVLDTAAEQAYDDITELAAFICGTPVSLVSLVGKDRQFFKSAHNLSVSETPRDQSFCAHTLLTAQTLVVEDATKDERFAHNPLVTGNPSIRFYAGAPIVSSDGHVFGTVCVIDSVPRSLSKRQLDALERLARQASNLLSRQALSVRTTRLEAEAIAAAEKAENQREALQRSLDAADVASWFYDPARNVVGGDARMGRLFGFVASETPEAPAEIWIDAIFEPDRAGASEAFAASLAGAPYDIKFRVVVDGEIRWLHSRAKSTPQLDGSAWMAGICEDVTWEETLAAELAETEDRLRMERQAAADQLHTFVESLPVLAWIANADGYITWYNRRWYDYTGTTPEQMEGWGWQSVHDPTVLSDVMERWTASIRTGRNFEMVFPLRGADGVFRPFLTRIEPLRDEQGSITQWFGTNSEVDALHKTQQALELSESVLKQVLIATNDAVITVRQDWTMVYSNPKAMELYGLKTDSIGRNVWEVLPATVYEGSPYVECFHRAMEKREAGKFEAEFGPPLNFVVGAEVYPSEDGIVVFSRDITKLKNAAAAVLQSEKLAAVGRLASAIAHEMNNPLEAVTNLLYIARTSDDLEVSRNYLASADMELRRVSAIANQTLRFHRQATRATEVTFIGLTEHLFRGFHSRLTNSNVEVRERDRTKQPVLCLEGEIHQVLVNLISNAIDAMHGIGGTLYVRGRDGQNWKTGETGMMITIADTGEGMSERTSEKLFEAFYTTKGIGGTGLGLWVSKEIVDRHRGRLSFKTSQRSHASGTVFRLFLPRRME